VTQGEIPSLFNRLRRGEADARQKQRNPLLSQKKKIKQAGIGQGGKIRSGSDNEVKEALTEPSLTQHNSFAPETVKGSQNENQERMPVIYTWEAEKGPRRRPPRGATSKPCRRVKARDHPGRSKEVPGTLDA